MEYLDENETILTKPYYIVNYIDDEGRKHIAMIKDSYCVKYYEDRYIVLSIIYQPEEK